MKQAWDSVTAHTPAFQSPLLHLHSYTKSFLLFSAFQIQHDYISLAKPELHSELLLQRCLEMIVLKLPDPAIQGGGNPGVPSEADN